MIALSVAEAVAALDAIDTDPETAHWEADEVLFRAAHPKVADAYMRCVGRTGPWWFA